MLTGFLWTLFVVASLVWGLFWMIARQTVGTWDGFVAVTIAYLGFLGLFAVGAGIGYRNRARE